MEHCLSDRVGERLLGRSAGRDPSTGLVLTRSSCLVCGYTWVAWFGLGFSDATNPVVAPELILLFICTLIPSVLWC